MALDPSIALSGNQMAAPRLPDVNAMMQTRTAGMENMYNIEQQRAAQAQAAQKEQAAAQETATIKALLPAYTYLFQTGDTVGVGNLVPPEMLPQVQPYIDALTGKSPEEVKSAVIGSLSSSPTGQEAMAAIQRAAAIDVQRGHLGVAQQQLTFDQSQVGVPKPMSAAEQASAGFREREVTLAEEKAAREAAMPEGMDVKTKVKFEQAYPKSSSALRTAVTGMDNTLGALKELIESPGLEAISGTVGAYTPNINADAKRAAALFDQIKAGAGLAALVELKQASPAGGALGNVSNQEGNTLRDSRGAFLQSQEYQDLRRALIDYYGVLERSKANIVGAFNDTYGYRGENAADEILGPMRQSQEQIDRDIQTQFPSASQTPPPSGGYRILNVR